MRKVFHVEQPPTAEYLLGRDKCGKFAERSPNQILAFDPLISASMSLFHVEHFQRVKMSGIFAGTILFPVEHRMWKASLKVRAS